MLLPSARPGLPRPIRIATFALLLGIYAFGLSEIAMLPPFEGFDEPGHYSYLQQIAETGTWPKHGDPMSADVDDVLKVAPTAAAMGPRWTYRSFAVAEAGVIAAGRDAIHAEPPTPRVWRAGSIVNWEAQHPPLYYALLAPAYRWSAGWSLGAQLLLLRAISYTLACAALVLSSLNATRYAGRSSLPPSIVILAPAVWPLMLPMWFPEMARLGNDSLVVLLAACVGLLAGQLIGEAKGPRLHLGLGLVLGLGLLTKATFLPLTLATLGLLAWRCWRLRRSADVKRACVGLMACGFACVCVAGWWYVAQAVGTGSVIGSNDDINLGGLGGLRAGLEQHGSVSAFLRMPVIFELSMVWAGTWSAVFPPFATIVPLLIAPVVLAGSAAVDVRTRVLTLIDVLAMLTLALFTLGLAYHSVILIAETGSAAPAWYLQSFAPVLWPLLAWGIAATLRWRWMAWVPRWVLGYSLPFLLIVTVVQALFFAGCAGLRTDTGRFDLAGSRACLAHPLTVFHNLEVIAFPALGVAFLAVAAVLLTFGCVSARSSLRTRTSTTSTSRTNDAADRSLASP